VAESVIWLTHPFAIPGGKRSPVTKVWENMIEGGEIRCIRILKVDLNSPNLDVESGHQITFIPAKILNVDKQADKHRVIVRILLPKYRASFDTLMFGENKPLIGSCHDGRLDLIYHRDPGLKEGQPFPLWTIQ
jgi:hypothetical protein